MKYQRQINFLLHDYATKKHTGNYMSRFLAIHKKLENAFYVQTLRQLIKAWEETHK